MITIIATIDRDSHRLRHDREQARARAVSWEEHEVLLRELLEKWLSSDGNRARAHDNDMNLEFVYIYIYMRRLLHQRNGFNNVHGG